MMGKALSQGERESMTTVLKLGWFLAVTAGGVIKQGTVDFKSVNKHADQLDSYLDKFLKEIK